MISKIVLNNSLNSITSFEKALGFRKEILAIDLDYLVKMVPEKIKDSIKRNPIFTGIFKKGHIVSSYSIFSSDKFFVKQNGELLQITDLAKIPEIKNRGGKIFIKSSLIESKIGHQGVFSLEALFGDYSFERTTEELQKCIAVQSFYENAQEAGLYQVNLNAKIPSLKRLSNTLDDDLWRDQLHEENIRRRALGQELIIPDETWFRSHLLNSITVNHRMIMDYVDEFTRHDEDCIYSVEVEANFLLFVKGIDHKYLPYYEQKFKPEE